MEEEIQQFLDSIKKYCRSIKFQVQRLQRPLTFDEISKIRNEYFCGTFLKLRLGALIDISEYYCQKTDTKFYFSQSGTKVQFLFCPPNNENFSQTIDISSLLKKNMLPIKDLRINLVDFLVTPSNTSRVFCRYSTIPFKPLTLEKLYIKYYLENRYETAKATLKPQIENINKQIQGLEKQKAKLQNQLLSLKANTTKEK